jgi:hypothetical protein
MFKTVLAVIGGTFVVIKTAQLYAQFLRGKYAKEYEEKLADYKREHPAPTAA